MDILILIPPIFFLMLLGSAMKVGGSVFSIAFYVFFFSRLLTAIAGPLIARLADASVPVSDRNVAGFVTVIGHTMILLPVLVPFALIAWRLLSHKFKRWQKHAIGAVSCVPMGYALTESFGVIGAVSVCTVSVITLALMMYPQIRDALSIPPSVQLDFDGAQKRYDEAYAHMVEKTKWKNEFVEQYSETNVTNDIFEDSYDA